MKPLSQSAGKVQASTTLAVDTLTKQMIAEGKDVIGFGTGEPDFDTPDHIKQAGIKAILDGKTKYTPAVGIPQLRQAVAEKIKKDCGVSYDWSSEIIVASGAKHSIYITLQALIIPGDEVILPAPYWVSHLEIIKLCGGKPVVVEAREEDDFKINPEQLQAAVTDKTKAFIINNPSNPTGMIYDKSELQALADVCVKNDLYVLADEIYYSLIYDGGEHCSFASLGEEVKERTILINGVSKSYAMTGWRIGYSAANKDITKLMSNYLSHSTGGPGTMNQWAAVEALNGPQDSIIDMRSVFEERRNYMVKRINEIDGVSCITPNGAFYVMMNIEELLGRTIAGVKINSCDDFAVHFLEDALVAVVPCSGFGAAKFVRWTYAASMENIEKAMDRLEEFLKKQ